MAPSPTAPATRLTDSARTSPATNTPGTEHSRWYGARDSGQSAGGGPPAASSPRAGRREARPAPRRAPPGARQRRAGAREAGGVGGEGLAEPLGRRLRPDEDEQPG